MFKAKPVYSPRGELRPLFVNMSTYNATNGRSPLCSLLYPTVKDRQTDVARFCEEQGPRYGDEHSSKLPSFLPSVELEKIVRHETQARNFR
jgi:hypothetical protein